MKGLKHVFIIASTCAVTAFSSAVYTSCTKDTCKLTHCQNKGTCSGGICSCKTGVGGANCETILRNKFSGEYAGFAPGNSANPGHGDSDIVLTFTPSNDSADFTTMTMNWKEPGFSMDFAAMIDSNKVYASSSKFIIPGQLKNGRYFRGDGTLTESTASVFITELDTATKVTYRYTFSGFYRK